MPRSPRIKRSRMIARYVIIGVAGSLIGFEVAQLTGGVLIGLTTSFAVGFIGGGVV